MKKPSETNLEMKIAETELLSLKNIAKKGDIKAQRRLAGLYYRGEDFEQAVHWFRLAANQGDDVAMVCLGFLYEKGEDVEQDLEQAAHWFRLAAEQGFPESQLFLGLYHYTGMGVEQDLGLAERWFQLAAEQGEELAQRCLEIFRTSSEPLDLDSELPTTINDDAIMAQLRSIKSYIGNDSAFLDMVYEIVEKPLFKRSSLELIKLGETQQVEFKETFSVNKTTGQQKDDVLRHAALKEICGFLNTNDGVLLIGVRDLKNRVDDLSAIPGIEEDRFSGDEDKYCLQVTQVINAGLGYTAGDLVSVTVENIDDKHICRIECRKSAEPVYYLRSPPVKAKGIPEEVGFVRYGTVTEAPPQKEWQRWCETKNLANKK